MRAFLTGSRVYGKPKEDSDIDLVVNIGRYEIDQLKKFADSVAEDNCGSSGGPASASMMFGRLNLLATADDDAFAVWKLGTTKCFQKMLENGRKPLKRSEAMKIFSKMRKIYLKEEQKGE